MLYSFLLYRFISANKTVELAHFGNIIDKLRSIIVICTYIILQKRTAYLKFYF